MGSRANIRTGLVKYFSTNADMLGFSPCSLAQTTTSPPVFLRSRCARRSRMTGSDVSGVTRKAAAPNTTEKMR